MKILYYLVATIAVMFTVSKIEDWWLGKKQAGIDRAVKTEEQIDDFIYDWVKNEEKTTTPEQFEETKKLLMADWIDSHPDSTRVDFQKYFDHRMECTINRAVYAYHPPLDREPKVKS